MDMDKHKNYYKINFINFDLIYWLNYLYFFLTKLKLLILILTYNKLFGLDKLKIGLIKNIGLIKKIKDWKIENWIN